MQIKEHLRFCANTEKDIYICNELINRLTKIVDIEVSSKILPPMTPEEEVKAITMNRKYSREPKFYIESKEEWLKKRGLSYSLPLKDIVKPKGITTNDEENNNKYNLILSNGKAIKSICIILAIITVFVSLLSVMMGMVSLFIFIISYLIYYKYQDKYEEAIFKIKEYDNLIKENKAAVQKYNEDIANQNDLIKDHNNKIDNRYKSYYDEQKRCYDILYNRFIQNKPMFDIENQENENKSREIYQSFPAKIELYKLMQKKEKIIIETEKKFIKDKIKELSGLSRELQENLNKLYDNINIHPKYRGLININSIYEYLDLGRADTLKEALNLYENYKFQKVVIDNLETIRTDIQKIKEQQYYTYKAINESNILLDKISFEINQMNNNILISMESLSDQIYESGYQTNNGLLLMNQKSQAMIDSIDNGRANIELLNYNTKMIEENTALQNYLSLNNILNH